MVIVCIFIKARGGMNAAKLSREIIFHDATDTEMRNYNFVDHATSV